MNIPRSEIKGTRYALLKNPWDLTRQEKQKLSDLQRTNARLYRAYLLKERLAQALDYRQPGHARRAFGLHSPPPLIAMLYLCCGGIQLNPPLPGPT